MDATGTEPRQPRRASSVSKGFLRERYVINTYGTIGNGMKPPFTTIVKYDLNVPSIKWRIGFGDDPALVDRGVTGTGVTQMRNSIIVTESGLVFGAGRDYQIRGTVTPANSSGRRGSTATSWARQQCTRWMAGSISWYLPRARQAAEAPVHSGMPPTPGGSPEADPPATGPMGWVAYTLPK